MGVGVHRFTLINCVMTLVQTNYISATFECLISTSTICLSIAELTDVAFERRLRCFDSAKGGGDRFFIRSWKKAHGSRFIAQT